MNPTFKNYKFRYIFTDRKKNFGFINELTVNSNTPENAIIEAWDELKSCYGSKMLKHFKITPID